MIDRIKLAEAMGLDLTLEWQDAAGHWHESERDFDPFTDANDDYAVLEWMREQPKEQFSQFALRCNIHWMDDWTLYKIGDYARAALKVLENE